MQQSARARIDRNRRTQQIASQTRGLLSTLEKEAQKHLTPLLRRFDLASRRDVDRLARRIARLERRLRSEQLRHRASSAARQRGPRPLPARATPQKETLDSQTYAELFWDEV